MDFERLVGRIQATSDALRQDALGVINRSITARAWLTGYYIVEFEQGGKARATYGDGLLKRLADRLSDKAVTAESLKKNRRFYQTFPELAMPIVAYLRERFGNGESAIPQLENGLLKRTTEALRYRLRHCLIARPILPSYLEVSCAHRTEVKEIQPCRRRSAWRVHGILPQTGHDGGGQSADWHSHVYGGRKRTRRIHGPLHRRQAIPFRVYAPAPVEGNPHELSQEGERRAADKRKAGR